MKWIIAMDYSSLPKKPYYKNHIKIMHSPFPRRRYKLARLPALVLALSVLKKCGMHRRVLA